MYRINGCGTDIYGQSKKEMLLPSMVQQGQLPYTYQATKWFVIVFIPIIPLGTYRIREVKVKEFIGTKTLYEMKRTDFDWKQALLHFSVVPILVTSIYLYAKLY
ncbi:hypothetical protein CCP4SC76_1220009 [Gammaproteobacteria bacterium]